MPEPIRLYLDEDTVNWRLVEALRSRGIGVLTAQEAGLIGVSDREHLQCATSIGRAILSLNTRDFVKMQTEYVEKSDIMLE